jgi:hypothetical protein
MVVSAQMARLVCCSHEIGLNPYNEIHETAVSEFY